MKRNPIIAILCAALLAGTAWAEPKGKAAETFNPGGIHVGKAIIRPGEALAVVFGFAGPPDQVRAMRSKQKKDDYVIFQYFSNGFSIDVNSENNKIQGILIEDVKVKVDGVPFPIGTAKKDVVAKWGEPERTQDNVMAYWKRGIYVGIDPKSSKVVNIFLTEPGKFDEATDSKPSRG